MIVNVLVKIHVLLSNTKFIYLTYRKSFYLYYCLLTIETYRCHNVMSGVSIVVHYFRLYQEDYLDNCFRHPLSRRAMLHQKSLVNDECS